MLNEFFKIFSIILIILLLFIIIFISLDYFRICEEVKQDNWELTNELKNCQKDLMELHSSLDSN